MNYFKYSFLKKKISTTALPFCLFVMCFFQTSEPAPTLHVLLSHVCCPPEVHEISQQQQRRRLLLEHPARKQSGTRCSVVECDQCDQCTACISPSFPLKIKLTENKASGGFTADLLAEVHSCRASAQVWCRRRTTAKCSSSRSITRQYCVVIK